jgi:hypothetical protein
MIRLFFTALVLASMASCALGQDPTTAVPPHSSAPSRLAVISTVDTADLAALVMTELSGNPGISLVERDDLAKIGDELKLQQLAGSDAVGLGKLVGADGLLFLNRGPNGLQVRFTAVGLGYALFDDEIASETDLPQLAKSISHRVAGYAPKLKLDPAKAIPLSILNLRADYGSVQSLQVERDLTLLLESRLTSVPEYVVLERRHAWSLGFEHSLDPAAKPLLRGAYLIDGTLSLSAPMSDDCKVALRIRVPKGKESTTVVEGSIENLPDFADKIVESVRIAIGGTVPTNDSASAHEANEYLREALWGWRSRAPEAALEAAESAELLGGNEADVVGLQAQALITLGDEGIETWYPMQSNEDNPPKFDVAGLARRTDFILRALHETARYRDEKMESKIVLLKTVGPFEAHNFQTDTMECQVVYVASKLLLLLDDAGLARADEVRRDLRAVTKYDPLHGKPGKTFPTNVNNNQARTQFADDWAQSLEEELAYYRLVCTDNELVLPTAMIQNPKDLFCTRFIFTPGARQQAFEDFVETLKSQPQSQRTYLVLKTHAGDPAVADKAYQDFLAVLWDKRDEIVQCNSYTPLLECFYDVDPAVVSRNMHEGLPLLHYLLTADKPGSTSTLLLKLLWCNQEISAEDAPVLWKEFNEYRKKHTEAAWQKFGHGDDSFDITMDQFVAPLVQKYPAICVPPPKSEPEIMNPLEVTKFWHPWTLSDTPDDRFLIQSWSLSEDGVWLGGLYTDGALYHVDLNRFTSERIPLPDKEWPQNIESVGDDVYITYHPSPAGTTQNVARYDLKSRTWQTQQLPELSYLKLFEANDSLYMFVTVKYPHDETALVRYNWAAGTWIELANNRRRPARNQYDDTEPLIDIGGIFTGPNHRPCVTLQEGTFYIQEEPGTWPPVFDDSYNSRLVTEGNRTLVMNFDGEVTLLDADASGPQYWVANPIPHIRQFSRPGKPNPPVPTPWTAQSRWKVPSQKTSNWRFESGFHGDNLYIFNIPREGTYCELLCYQPGRQTPQHIPLSFHLDDTDRRALASPKIRMFDWTPDCLEHPEYTAAHLASGVDFHVLATSQGLCLLYGTNGFWFIPYGDMENYLKAHPGNQADSVPPVTTLHNVPKAGASSTAGDADFDAGDATSFR